MAAQLSRSRHMAEETKPAMDRLPEEHLAAGRRALRNWAKVGGAAQESSMGRPCSRARHSSYPRARSAVLEEWASRRVRPGRIHPRNWRRRARTVSAHAPL